MLGRGGYAEVWLCVSEAVPSYRALKFVSGATPENSLFFSWPLVGWLRENEMEPQCLKP